MAIITKIQLQKNNTERYNIYIDKGKGEEYAFSVDANVLVQHSLRKGMEIDELEMSSILYEEEVRKAYLQAVSYLSYQMRSRQEIEEYLRKKEVGQAVIAEAVAKLVQEKYVNDAEYAMAYVRTQSNVARKGPVLIRRELAVKGIDETIIIHSLHEYSSETQITNALHLCEKKKPTYKNVSFLQMKQKLEEMLIRKGYDKGVISICMEALQDDGGADEQWDALVYQAGKYHAKYKKYEGWEYATKMKGALYRKGFPLELIEKWLSEQE